MRKVLIGVDTQGVMYELEEESPYVKRWRMVNHIQVNLFQGGQFQYSGDSVEDRRQKVLYSHDIKAMGVVMGDLRHDYHYRDARSLLQSVLQLPKRVA